MPELKKALTDYHDSGFNVVPCKGKAAVVRWAKYQSDRITNNDITNFSNLTFDSIAIICGKGSGQLEVIDIDDTSIVDSLLQQFKLTLGDDYNNLWISHTKSGGCHVYYRCDQIEGNLKLANNAKGEVRVETRGQGGYVIAPPSPGYTWTKKSGELVELLPVQRDEIIDICRSYNDLELYEKEETRPKSSRTDVYRTTPWDAYDDTYEFERVLIKHGWSKLKETAIEDYWQRPGNTLTHSAKFSHKMRTFYIHSTSVQPPLEAGKAYRPSSLRGLLEYGGDFTKSTEALSNEGYGERWERDEIKLIHKKALEYHPGMTIANLLDDTNVAERDKPKMMGSIIGYHGVVNGKFWNVSEKGKYTIQGSKLQNYFRKMGLFKYRMNKSDSSYMFVVIDKQKHTISRIADDQVKRMVFEDVQSMGLDYVVTCKIIDEWMKKRDIKHLFDFCEEILDKDIIFLRDTKTSAFFTFKNIIIEVTANDVRSLRYEDLEDNVYIWHHNIKDRKVNLCNFKNNPSELNQSVFYQFLKRVVGFGDDEMEMVKDFYSSKKFEALGNIVTTIGYLLHTYKDRIKPWAVAITEDTDEAGKGGGTGKGLLLQALSQIRSLAIQPGKQWTPSERFAWQRIELGTEIMAIDDTTKRFDFEEFNNIISEDMVVEKKNRDAIEIPYERSPKVVITTNYDISTNGIHGERRLKRIPLQKYFTKDLTPFNEFGCRFFTDEDDQWAGQWDDFFNTMFFCVQQYLSYGIIEVSTSLALKRKSLINRFYGVGDNAWDWLVGFFKSYDGKMYTSSMMLTAFIEEVRIKKLSPQAFTSWVQWFCEAYNIDVIRHRSGSRYKQFKWDGELVFIEGEAGIKCPELQYVKASDVPKYEDGSGKEVLGKDGKNVMVDELDDTPF